MYYVELVTQNRRHKHYMGNDTLSYVHITLRPRLCKT